MAAELGADVDLDNGPLKYEGLSYTEIWISESQERMVLSVPPAKLAAAEGAVRHGGRGGGGARHVRADRAG